MRILALFKSGNVEDVDISFYETSSEETGAKIFTATKMSVDLKNSAKAGITDTFIMLRGIYSTKLPKAVCVNVKGFAKETIGSSADLAFAVAFAMKIFKHYRLGSYRLPKIIAVTGVIDQRMQICKIYGLKEKFIGAVKNGARLVIYPKENEAEFVQLKSNDKNFEKFITTNRVNFVAVESLKDALVKIGLIKESFKNNLEVNFFSNSKILNLKFSIVLKIFSISIILLLLLVSMYFLWNNFKSGNTKKVIIINPSPSLQTSIEVKTPLPTPTTTLKVETTSYHVSTAGNDSNVGTIAEPLKTIQKGLTLLKPGDTLFIHGGTYNERIINPHINSGTSSSRIIVKNFDKDKVIINGLLWLESPSFWTIDSIKVTWSSLNKSNEHMVKVSNGTTWEFLNCEFYGAKSNSCMAVQGAPTNLKIANCYIHDTYATNNSNQDHNLYLNYTSATGLIEHCVFANSSNGCGIKVDQTEYKQVGNMTIRYCTFYNNNGPSNIQLAYTANSFLIYMNIFQKPSHHCVTFHKLIGSNNKVYKNVGFNAKGVVEKGNTGLTDTGQNISVNPQFINPSKGDFHTKNQAVSGYGMYAK
jgi:hypothetical protein